MSGKKRENKIIFIILLDSLYYFYWIVCKNKNWDVGWVVKWVSKIDKIAFEDAKYFFFFFFTSPTANVLLLFTYYKKILDIHPISNTFLNG